MIYTNSLGNPEAKATITATTDCCYTSKIKYYSLSKSSNAPDKKWGADATAAEMVADMAANGWDCEVGHDGYGHIHINCVHTETMAVISGAKDAEEKKFEDAEKGYIRFGRIPMNGKSWNFRDNKPEAGISVFEAEFTKNGEYRVLVDDVLELSYLTVMDRDAYRVYGDVVGIGADGEPVLKITKRVKL